jgi:hypothetical protein
MLQALGPMPFTNGSLKVVTVRRHTSTATLNNCTPYVCDRNITMKARIIGLIYCCKIFFLSTAHLSQVEPDILTRTNLNIFGIWADSPELSNRREE